MRGSIGFLYFLLLGLMIHILHEHYGHALKFTETEAEPEPLYMESFYLCFIIKIAGLLLGKDIFMPLF